MAWHAQPKKTGKSLREENVKRQSSMAKKAAATKRPPKKQPRKKTPARKPPANLRQTLYGLGLWALGILNAILIASFIIKHVSPSETANLQADNIAVASKQETVVRLEVLNGCGEKGIASRFADYLQPNGFKPVFVGNYETFDWPKTVILDRKSRNRVIGLRLAEILDVSPGDVHYQASDRDDIDVSIIIGKDFNKFEFLGK